MLYVKGNSEKHIVWSVLSLDHSVRPPSQILARTPLISFYLILTHINSFAIGTPIGKSLNDLYGLFMFLNLDPYNLEYWWKKCLYNPYIRGKTRDLEKVLSKIMWRTAKKDVLDQINIPKQTEEIHWLSFSPVEEHFYRRQHIDSSKEAVAKIKKVPNQELKLSEMDRHSLNTLLMPLLRLRQSCCHPQAVKGQFMSLQKSTMTMEALMDQMIKKSTLECEEANRQYISSLNGLAGLDIIEEKFVEAVEKYREVLRFTEEYKDKIKTDTLQVHFIFDSVLTHF